MVLLLKSRYSLTMIGAIKKEVKSATPNENMAGWH